MRIHRKPIGSWLLPAINMIVFRKLLIEPLQFIIVTTTSLSIVITLQQLTRRSEIFLTGIPLNINLMALFCLILEVLPFILPLSISISIILGINRQESDKEITALFSLGQSYKQLYSPIIYLTIIIALQAFLLLHFISPWFRTQLIQQQSYFVQQIPPVTLAIQKLTSLSPETLIYANNMDNTTGKWLGVFLVQKNTPDGTYSVLSAAEASPALSPTRENEPLQLMIELFKGKSIRLSNEATPPQEIVGFEKTTTRVTGNQFSTNKAIALLNREYQNWDSLKILEKVRTKTDGQLEKSMTIELYRRTLIPLNLIVLAFIAIQTSLFFKNSGSKITILILNCLIAIIQYLLLSTGQRIAMNSMTSPRVMWLTIIPILAIPLIITAFRRRLTKLLSRRASLSTASDKSTDHSYSASSNKTTFTPAQTLNLMIIKQIIVFTLLATSILTALALTFTLFDLIPSIIKNNPTPSLILSYFANLAPQIIYYTLPFGILTGISASTSILTKTRELIAMRSAGRSEFQIAIPAILIATAAGSLIAWQSETNLPITNRNQDQMYSQIKGKKIDEATIALNKKWTISSNNSIYCFDQIQKNDTLLKTLSFNFSSDFKELCSISYLSEATKSGSLPDSWLPVGATWSEPLCNPQENQPTPGFQVPEGASLFRKTYTEASKLTYAQLKTTLSFLPEKDLESAQIIRIELQKKLAYPFSCLILALIIFPIQKLFTSRKLMSSIIASQSVGIAFWILSLMLERAGKQSYLPPVAAVWGSYIIFSILTLYLLFRTRNK